MSYAISEQAKESKIGTILLEKAKQFNKLGHGELLFLSVYNGNDLWSDEIEERDYEFLGAYVAPLSTVAGLGKYQQTVQSKSLSDNVKIFEIGYFISLALEGNIGILEALASRNFVQPHRLSHINYFHQFIDSQEQFYSANMNKDKIRRVIGTKEKKNPLKRLKREVKTLLKILVLNKTFRRDKITAIRSRDTINFLSSFRELADIDEQFFKVKWLVKHETGETGLLMELAVFKSILLKRITDVSPRSQLPTLPRNPRIYEKDLIDFRLNYTRD